MGERAIENRVRKLQEIEAQRKALEEQAEKLKEEIKADMERKGVDEIETPNFSIRWKEIVSNRLDSAALKKALPEIYKQYARQITSKRFTVA
jgi:predicted phage-related endonuclease